MADSQYIGASFEERELKKKVAARKRIRNIFFILIATVIARIFIKDPQPPAPAAHRETALPIAPGLLEAIPESARSSLDPRLIAKLQLADQRAREEKKAAVASATYQPFVSPSQHVEMKQKFVMMEARKRRIISNAEPIEKRDLSKTQLVLFRSGGFIKAEQTSRTSKTVDIRVDRSISAQLPGKMVASITDNALTWEEPVPSGFVRLKPARGITITLSKEASKRISNRRRNSDDI